MREQNCGPSPESSPSSSASRSRSLKSGSPLAPALRDVTRPKPRKTLSFSEQVEHRSISPNPRPGDDRHSTARSSGKSAPMQSSSLPDLFAYGTGLADFQDVGMQPDDKTDGSANKQEEFAGAAEAAQQEPHFTSGADTRGTRLAHEKMPEPEEEPAEAAVAQEDATACRTLEQSSRYADLTLDEATLVKNGEHVLVAYIMKPKMGYDYLATAAHFAAESCTGARSTDDAKESANAVVYYIDADSQEMRIAYPTVLFDSNLTDGREMVRSFLTLAIGNTQGMEDVEFGKIYDFYLPPSFLRLQESPSVNTMWRILDKGASNGGLAAAAMKPKLGMTPKPFRAASYVLWQGGAYTAADVQANQAPTQASEGIPEVVKAMRSCVQGTDVAKRHSGGNYTDESKEMDARGKYVLSQFGPFSGNCVSLVAGYAAGGSARHTFPRQFVHYHRAGQASTSSPQTQRGYSAFVHTKISQVITTTSIHVDTMSFGKTHGDSPDKSIAVMLQDDAADARLCNQEWEGMRQNAPIISGSMNALRLPAFFETLGNSNVILTADSGSFGHKDGPASGAIACRQVEEAWKAWRSGQYGNVSLSDGVVEFAKTHEEIKGAFLTFPKDADEIYPGWKEKLGCTGEASVPPASFVNAKISPASSTAAATARTTMNAAKMASQSTAGSVVNPKMASESTAGSAVNPYTGGVKSIQGASSSNTARSVLLSRQGREAALQDSPKQKQDVRVASQTDPQVISSDKKTSVRIERASTDSQLAAAEKAVNPSAGLAKTSHDASGGSRTLMGTGSTSSDVPLQRRGSMSLLQDPLKQQVDVHAAYQTLPHAQALERHVELSLNEATLMKNGEHVLVAYTMKPKMGYDYLATAAHFAAESCTGARSTDDAKESANAVVYYIDADSQEMRIAYPTVLFDSNLTDGREMVRSFLTLAIGNTQGMEDVEFGKIYDFYLPPSFLRLQESPSVNTMWRILDKGASNGGLAAAAMKPKLGMTPKPFRAASYALWQGGAYTAADVQANQAPTQASEGIPEVVKAMRSCVQGTDVAKRHSGGNYTDESKEMDARGKYVLSQFGPFSGNCVSLVAGYAAGGSARHTFPRQFVHYHRAGQASTSSPQTQRGYSAFVHTKISQVISTTSIHADTMSFGKTHGDSHGKSMAVMLQDDAADARLCDQRREGMTQSAPGIMNALRLPAFFETLGHSNVILTADSGSFGHKDGPASGAIACRQVEEAWKAWRSGQYGNVSLSDGVVEFAKTHKEIKGAFLTFPKDADEIYPGWKEKLGCTGKESVPPASFVNAKISPASSTAAATARTTMNAAKMASQSTAGSVVNPKMASESTAGSAVNPYAGVVKSIQGASSSNTARTMLATENVSRDLSRQGREAALQDSPKQNQDVRVASQTDPQVISSDKKTSVRIERASTDSQLAAAEKAVNPSAGLAKTSHDASGGSRTLMGTGSTSSDVPLQRRGSMSLLQDPLKQQVDVHAAYQTLPHAQVDSGNKFTETASTMGSGTQTSGIADSVPGPVMKREVAWSCRTLLEDGPPLRFQAATEVPVSLKTDASGRRHSLPSSLLTRDATKPRPKKTLRFSEHVDHRSISPRPRSASAPENSGTADKLRGKTMAAQAGTARSSASKPSTASKPVPVQSSSFSEFLFLPPVSENKTEPPPQSLSNFLFAPNGSTAQHAVPAVEMESSRRSGEEHHPSSAHHHGSDAHHRSTGDHHHRSDAHRHSSEAHHRGSESHRSNDTHHRSSDAHHRSSDAHHGHGKGSARKRKHDDKHDKGIQETSSTTASTSTSSSSSSAGEPANLASRGEVSGTMVHHSSSFQVTEEMAREAYERGLGCCLERRVLERAYFLFQNGQSEDADFNYFTALRIELSESG
ncbi:rbcG [Symbiodinium sp. CCMP2592]|nr:rbcG [Symbiodinium sp. CCMP2592]